VHGMRHLLETATNLSAAREVLQKTQLGFSGRVAFDKCGACDTDVEEMRRGGLWAGTVHSVIGKQSHFRILHRQHMLE
jgi:hypothetical protein